MVWTRATCCYSRVWASSLALTGKLGLCYLPYSVPLSLLLPLSLWTPLLALYSCNYLLSFTQGRSSSFPGEAAGHVEEHMEDVGETGRLKSTTSSIETLVVRRGLPSPKHASAGPFKIKHPLNPASPLLCLPASLGPVQLCLCSFCPLGPQASLKCDVGLRPSLGAGVFFCFLVLVPGLHLSRGLCLPQHQGKQLSRGQI